jgi:hypothetical protein
MNRRTIAIILIIIISVSQTGCTFLVRVFIRNLTDRPLELKFYRSTEKVYQPELYFDYKDHLIKINQETLKQLDKKVAIDIDGTEVTLTIPSKSTISIIPFLTSDTATLETEMKKLGIKSGRQAILIQDGIIKDSLNIVNFTRERKFKKKGGLFVNKLYYYDFGKSKAQ